MSKRNCYGCGLWLKEREFEAHKAVCLGSKQAAASKGAKR